MPTTPSPQSALPQILENSRGFHLLIPTFQQSLRQAIQTGDQSQQRALSMILSREKPADLQSVFFTEEVLQNFVETNLAAPQDPAQLLLEYREKARNMLGSFLFFTVAQKNEILPYIDSLNLDSLKKLINLYKLGHHKQDQYLRIFAEKDPRMATKFKLISSGATKQLNRQIGNQINS